MCFLYLTKKVFLFIFAYYYKLCINNNTKQQKFYNKNFFELKLKQLDIFNTKYKSKNNITSCLTIKT